MSLHLPASGSRRVFRGGCWYSVPERARVAFRGSLTMGYRYDILGVRFVRRCP